MKDLFYKALEKDDVSLMHSVDKSDLHCHADRGAYRKHFEKEFDTTISDNYKFCSIKEMDEWYDQYLAKYFDGFEGMVKRYISMFKVAEEQNIKVFAPSFCLGRIKYFNNDIGLYLTFIQKLKDKYAPSVEFYPELVISRYDDVLEVEKLLQEVVKYNFFKSIDLIGNEELGTEKFKEIYSMAHKFGLVLKAHVGEFAGVEYMDKAIQDLNLDVINHGLAAIDSKEMMKYLRDSRIMLNICPSSNVLLSRVASYEEHPIKEFVKQGITCTINTDDLLIFNKTVSDEYLTLYKNGVLGKEELNKIREDGLTLSLRKKM